MQQSVELPNIRNTLDDQVPIRLMFADPLYSRSLDKTFVARIIKLWDRHKVGVIYLSLRPDGSYAIIDGRHRVTACRQVEGENAVLPARVFIDLSVTQEAALWDAFNRYRRRPQQVDIFRARLVANDETAIKIEQAVESAELHLDLSGRQHGGNSIVAVAALEHAYQRVGEHGLIIVLKLLREAFADDERGYQAPTIDGLSMIWARYGSIINRSRLIDVLRKVGATRLLTLAHEYRAIHLGMPVAGAWARVVVLQYNRGLRSHTLSEW